MTCLAPLQGSMPCPHPEDGQDLCLTQTGVLQKKKQHGAAAEPSPTQTSAPRAEPPGIKTVEKQGEELCQTAGQGHEAEVGEGSQLKKETVNYTNALQFNKGCPTDCKTIEVLFDLLQNQMLQLKGPLCPALFSSEL